MFECVEKSGGVHWIGGMFVRLCLLLICVNECTASPPLRCTKSTSTSLLVEWDAVDGTDLYYVALLESPSDRPFALR
jgi:hypothetical protein